MTFFEAYASGKRMRRSSWTFFEDPKKWAKTKTITVEDALAEDWVLEPVRNSRRNFSALSHDQKTRAFNRAYLALLALRDWDLPEIQTKYLDEKFAEIYKIMEETPAEASKLFDD